ncbi:MAG: hypothetical protein EA406_14550 [Rhodospirillales bacterium]|nr:MAG: hypothetical protein EA406_14550 [Rhodospirillales bacterium]
MQKFRNSYERLTDDRLGDIADHIASFAPPAAPAGLAPFGAPAAFAGMEAQRAEDVLSRLLGTALAPAGKAVGADFAQMLTLALDQRVASEEDGGYQVLTSVAPVVAGIRQPPRGRQASLLRDVQSQSEAFLKIMRELPSKRRNPDQTAITDHRGRLGRYVEDLISLTGFESGPLIERASFQVDAIEREWTALKRELGILLNGQVHAANVAAVGENILDSGRKARLVNRSLEEAEGEEIDSEAKRGDDYLERINNAFASWEKDRKQSRGAKTARLLQHVRSLQDNVRQLERAFDLAELTLQDRLSRRFKVGGDGDAPVQALIDWLTEDGKRWMQELSDGDTRATVLDAIIHGAEKQAILVESLDEALEQLVSVGRGRVKRALREVSGALDAITDEANRLQQP